MLRIHLLMFRIKFLRCLETTYSPRFSPTSDVQSIVADEVTDCSNKEQLSLVLRYVYPDTLQIREDLIQFIECDTGITGRALADKMTDTISALGLNLQNLCG